MPRERRRAAQVALDALYNSTHVSAEDHTEEDERSDASDYEIPEIAASNLEELSNMSDNDDEEEEDSDGDVLQANDREWRVIQEQSRTGPGRQSAQNILRHRPGFIDGLHPSNEKESFMTFIRSVLPDIVRYTNLEARRQIQRSEWLKPVWQETTETEILAFLGIHLLCGAYKAHYRDIKEIFSERDGIPAVYCTMSLQRFACIRRLIRFDDRLRRNPDDPFGPVRDIWTSIINEFRRVYKPSSTVTIDEKLVEFHGRVKFRMYIPSKPGKYGIKMIWLVDNSNTFVLNGLVYIGRQTLNEEE